MDDVHKSHVEVADVRQQLMIADVVGWVELLYRDVQSAIRDASNLCDGVVSQDVAEGPTWTQMPEVVAQIEDRGETKFVLSSAATQAQQARGMQPDHDEASIQPNEAQPEALEREAEHMMDKIIARLEHAPQACLLLILVLDQNQATIAHTTNTVIATRDTLLALAPDMVGA